MQLIQFISTVTLASAVSAHYTFYELITNGALSTSATRVPSSYWPITQDKYPGDDNPIQSDIVRCNDIGTPATETRIVSPGDTIGFHIANTTGFPLTLNAESAMIYHEGPAAFYVAKAPSGTVTGWDGADGEWVKIAQWSATFQPLVFAATNKTELTTTLPNLPSGEYLLRAEHIQVAPDRNVESVLNFFVSCAQINVVNGTGTLPTGVKIPGYITGDEDGLYVDILTPEGRNITSYTPPGPPVWQG